MNGNQVDNAARATAKEQIEDLVANYEKLTVQQRRAMNESQNCKDFILRLFYALGWDVYSDEILSEENILGKRADYTFRLNGVARFFLEAKKPSAKLQEEDFADQAISYAWHKSVSWAVLTNFETLKVFNAEWDEVDSERSLVFEIKYTDFATSDKLALLSRDAIEKGELDSWAEREFKKPKRENVDSQLAKDLLRWRNILFENLTQWNGDKKIESKSIAKAVQMLLDRLIFIRTTEDRGIENEHLRELLRHSEEDKIGNADLERELKELFKSYNDWYDSKLFEPHLCDELEYADDFLKTVIGELYKNRKGIRYNFAKINADVLGSIYEQYLGQIQQSDAKNSKRKQQGIYYTPRYIVDFIVRNTLGDLIKDKLPHEIAKLRILDPACGSGSFLTRAFEFLNQTLQKQGWDNAGTPLTVIPNCVYGVDLDDEAVEIAQLNLLLRMVYARERLPDLNHNVECGNSLISDSTLKEKRPFDWGKRFGEVFDGGGFDAIIGNPPYIKEDLEKSVFDGLHDSPYYQGKMDIWTLFTCQAIDHLKDGGYFSFIAPNSWLTNAGASIFRDKILKEGEIISFVDFGDFKVFKDAGIQTMIFVFKKRKPREQYSIQYAKVTDSDIAQDRVSAFLGSNRSDALKDGIENFEVEFVPEKFYGKTISFNNSTTSQIIENIEGGKSFHLSNGDIGNGIDVLQDFVSGRHLDALQDKSIRKGDGIFVLSSNEINGLHLTKGEYAHLKPYYSSREVGRYLALPETDYKIIYADTDFRSKIENYPNLKSHIDKFKNVLTSAFAPYGLHRSRDERFFKGLAIFSLRKTALPAFSYVGFPCYVSRAFLIIRPPNINLKYLTAIFNSKLSCFWFKNRGKLQGDNLQIDKEPLMNFPIRTTDDNKIEQKIITLVDKVVSLNTELHKLDSVLEREEHERIKKSITEAETEIDGEIYRTYNLTPEEISVIEN